MSELWYYAEGTEQRGPITEDTLRQMLRDGHLTASHLAWRPGMSEWLPISAIAEVTPDVSAGPPPLTQVAYASPQQINYFNPAQTTVVYAGFWLRVGAYIIDYLVLADPESGIWRRDAIGHCLAIAGGKPSWALGRRPDHSEHRRCADVHHLALLRADGDFAETRDAGKDGLRNRCHGSRGESHQLWPSHGRYFGKILSGMILCIGYMMAGWTAKKQALHDELAKTLVVRKQLPQGAL